MLTLWFTGCSVYPNKKASKANWALCRVTTKMYRILVDNMQTILMKSINILSPLQ